MGPIKVAHTLYKVVPISHVELDFSKVYGETNHHEATIRLASDLKGTKFTEVLLHEILHACFKMYLPSDYVKDDMEEQLVGQMGVALAQVFNDNPHILWEIANALAGNVSNSEGAQSKGPKRRRKAKK